MQWRYLQWPLCTVEALDVDVMYMRLFSVNRLWDGAISVVQEEDVDTARTTLGTLLFVQNARDLPSHSL